MTLAATPECSAQGRIKKSQTSYTTTVDVGYELLTIAVEEQYGAPFEFDITTKIQ